MAEAQTISTTPSDYERLLRFVTRSGPEFALAMVRYADPNVRDRLIQQIQNDALQLGSRVKRLDLHDLAEDANLLETLASSLKQDPDSLGPINALFVVRLEHALVDPLGVSKIAPNIRGFNIARDQLPTRVPTRLVLWLSDAAANALANHARDLYDVVFSFYRFDDHDQPKAIHLTREVPGWMQFAQAQDIPKLRREAALLEDVFENDVRGAPRADAAARIGQIEVLTGNTEKGMNWWQRALAFYETDGNVNDAAELHLKIGDQFFLNGDLEAAMNNFEKAKELFQSIDDPGSVAVSQGQIADILQARGQFDEALKIRTEQELPVYEQLGSIRNTAITQGKIADILRAQGQLDEALKIRIEQTLPVYEQLGDIREAAVTQGKIADIFQARGQLDEALKIRTEQELPVYEQLGDIRNTAVTRGQIADIFQARGQLDEALKIRTEQELPVYEQLGDIRSAAIAQGKITDILQARGQLDEALKIRTEQTLPVYEQLGDIREAALTRGKIADILWQKGEHDLAIDTYRNKVLPVYIQLGDKRALLVDQGNLAQMLLARDQPNDKSEAFQLFQQALQAAQEMRIPEAAQIQNMIAKHFGTQP